MSEKRPHLVFQVMNFIFSPESDNYRLLPVDRLLLLSLAKHNGFKGMCPSTKLLAKELKISPTYVKRLINKLDELKVIKVERKFGCSHRYTFLFLSVDQATTVDRSIVVDRSTVVTPTGQLQVHNRSTPVDTISKDQLYKKREHSLFNFLPDEGNILLCQDLRLDLAHELESFKNRHKGQANQYEFSRWLKSSKAYQSKKSGNGEVRSTVPWFSDNH